MRILIVEDNIRLADTLADALRAENYMVDIANDGLKGYEDAASSIYDILILDLMLPKMNGYEVLSALRSDGNHIPVLILSARAELDDKVQGFRVGADDYVTKPFEIEELIMRIQAITRRRISQDIDMQFLRAGDLAFDNNTCEISNTDDQRKRNAASRISADQSESGAGKGTDCNQDLGIRIECGIQQCGSLYFLSAPQVPASAGQHAYPRSSWRGLYSGGSQ